MGSRPSWTVRRRAQTVFWAPGVKTVSAEVPGMFKLLDALGMEDDQIEVYAMNKDKITTANYEKTSTSLIFLH